LRCLPSPRCFSGVSALPNDSRDWVTRLIHILWANVRSRDLGELANMAINLSLLPVRMLAHLTLLYLSSVIQVVIAAWHVPQPTVRSSKKAVRTDDVLCCLGGVLQIQFPVSAITDVDVAQPGEKHLSPQAEGKEET
jgi:hypothetical protein